MASAVTTNAVIKDAVTTGTPEEMPMGGLGGSRVTVVRELLYIEFNPDKSEARIHAFFKNQVHEFKKLHDEPRAQIFTTYYRKIAAEAALQQDDIQKFIDSFYAEKDSFEKMAEDMSEKMADLPELFKKKEAEAEERTGRSCKAFLIALLVTGIAAIIIGGALCACPNLLPIGISLLAIGFLTITIASRACSVKNCQNAHSR